MIYYKNLKKTKTFTDLQRLEVSINIKILAINIKKLNAHKYIFDC